MRKDETPVNLRLSSRPLGHNSLEYQGAACGLHECESYLPLEAGRILLVEPRISCDSQKERINTQLNQTFLRTPSLVTDLVAFQEADYSGPH